MIAIKTPTGANSSKGKPNQTMSGCWPRRGEKGQAVLPEMLAESAARPKRGPIQMLAGRCSDLLTIMDCLDIKPVKNIKHKSVKNPAL